MIFIFMSVVFGIVGYCSVEKDFDDTLAILKSRRQAEQPDYQAYTKPEEKNNP